MANTGPDGKYGNIVYVFVPFRFDGDVAADRQAKITRVLRAAKGLCARKDGGQGAHGDPVWEDGADGIRSYFLKYLTDKIAQPAGGQPDRRGCVYLSAKERRLGWAGDRDGAEWEKTLEAQRGRFGFSMADVFHLYQPTYMDNTSEKVDFRFRLDSLKLSVFGTGVGIVSFGMVMDLGGALDIAHAEYLLKMATGDPDPSKVAAHARSRILWREGDSDRTDLTAMAMRVVQSVVGPEDVRFGFYSQKPRVNVFSLVLAGDGWDGADFERKRFYLSNGYGPGYMSPDDNRGADAQYLGDPNICWGVSNEVACCIARPELHPPAKHFIYDSFYYKFRREYLFMYIWLLHQKYALYAFLTDISAQGLSVASPGKGAALRDYKRRFADFEANYVFARVTEVPQYQRLYDAVSRQFALQSMYDDVKEPLVALEELARDDEARIKEREQRSATRITTILAGMALLSVFSAYVDSYDFIGKFFGGDQGRQEEGILYGQKACAWLITVVICLGLVYLLYCACKGAFGRKKGGT